MLTFIILLNQDSNNDKETIFSEAAIKAIFGKLVSRVGLIFFMIESEETEFWSNYELC